MISERINIEYLFRQPQNIPYMSQNRKIQKLWRIILLVFILTSCDESFLDLKPIAMETEETFYSTFDAVDFTVTAAYSRITLLNYDVTAVLTGQVGSDDVETGGANAADGANWKLIEQFAHTPGQNDFEFPWMVNYKGIRLANTALTYLPRFLASHPELARQRIAECKFLLAFYHFQLLQLYGGVPIVDKVLNPAEFTLGRNSIAEVLHFIQKTLEEGLPDLKTRSQLGMNEVGRASKGAAQALLAKAYLFESSYAKYHGGDERFAGCTQKFDKAAQAAEAVIASNEYRLVGIDGERYKSWWAMTVDPMPADSMVGGFRWLFSTDGDNSPEGVWEAQNAMDGRGWAQGTGNGLVIFTTCRWNTVVSSGWDQGWGFNTGSLYLQRAFRNLDNRYLNLSAENMEEIGQYDDPRFGTTMGLEGDLMVVREPYNADGVLKTAGMTLHNVPTGSACRKHECHPDEFQLNKMKSGNESGPINWKIIRYAETILIAAEAHFENGNTSRALELVNMIRTRARNSNNNADVSTHIYPKNLSSLTFEDIVHERRLELALEHHRFQDLVRWNLAGRFINGITLELIPDKPIQFDQAKHLFFPLPAKQVQLSEGNLVQYPGWQN